MKLLAQSHSPFARKVVVVVHELECCDIEIEHQETSPTNPNPSVSSANPLGKVPVLLSEGDAIYDSRVICEYLCRLYANTTLIPEAMPERVRALRYQALADGMCDVGISARWEIERRPENLRYPKLRDGFLDKLTASFAYLERSLPKSGEVTIGTIALACALDWLAFRELGFEPAKYPGLQAWLVGFCERASMQKSCFEGETFD